MAARSAGPSDLEKEQVLIFLAVIRAELNFADLEIGRTYIFNLI